VRSTLYRDAALADGRSPRLQVSVSLLAEDGRVRWIRPVGDEGACPRGCEVVDAGGTTIVPGLVDGHSHLTLPGGSHWIERGHPTGSLDPAHLVFRLSEGGRVVDDLQTRPWFEGSGTSE
jgi:imidazolonepropionase-like amidohydrolase